MDHVGIVEKVVSNTIYTIEGDSGDMCREKTYEIGNADILGFEAVDIKKSRQLR